MSISEITSAGCRVLIVPWTYRSSFQSNVTITLFFMIASSLGFPAILKRLGEFVAARSCQRGVGLLCSQRCGPT